MLAASCNVDGPQCRKPEVGMRMILDAIDDGRLDLDPDHMIDLESLKAFIATPPPDKALATRNTRCTSTGWGTFL